MYDENKFKKNLLIVACPKHLNNASEMTIKVTAVLMYL